MQGAVHSSALAKRSTNSGTNDITCVAVKSIDSHIDSILSKPKLYLQSKRDDCILQLIDSMSAKYLATKNEKYMRCLESISAVSDGYVAEDIGIVLYRMFVKDPTLLCSYIYEQRSSNSKLIMQLASEVLLSGRKREYINILHRTKLGKVVVKYFELSVQRLKL